MKSNRILTRLTTIALPWFTAALLAGCGPQSDIADAAPAARPGETETEARTRIARETCREALLDTLDHPDSAALEPLEEWSVTRQPDDTIRVELGGAVLDALGETIDGRWECVVLRDGAGMRLVTLTVVDL